MQNAQRQDIEIHVWPYVYGCPANSGKIKTQPDDFIVHEQLPFQPEGPGEHAFLQIEKCGENTEYVARLLARFAGVRQRDIGYAGLKDRHARTRQWFSVWLPGKEDPDWKLCETDHIKILTAVRHVRKLKRGVLSANAFQIRIRELQGDRDKLVQQLALIKEQGFPNYFGAQRFGHLGQNVTKALALFDGAKAKREQRSLYLSAARSYLFNQLLAKRIKAGNWNQPVNGDILIFNQSNSYFKAESPDESVYQRIVTGEVHPTGMMFGKGERGVTAQALDLEDAVISQYRDLAAGLNNAGLTADRRSLRVLAQDLKWEFRSDDSVLLDFSLPPGSYATSLIRELIDS